MNGRFPLDILMIIVIPFIAIAMGFFVPTLLIPAYVHHRLAVAVAVTVAVIVALIAIAVGLRRRRRTARRR
jgi:predicted cobalt transporter CbtA